MQVEEIYFGQTKEQVIESARQLIVQWPEYAELTDQEIIELIDAGRIFEFDLVEIEEEFPQHLITKKELIEIYEKHYGGHV